MIYDELYEVLLTKMKFTENIYQRLQFQFPELRNGKKDLTWEEMWKYLDRIDEKITPEEERKMLLPSHLLENLSKEGYNVFRQMPPPKKYYTNNLKDLNEITVLCQC